MKNSQWFKAAGIRAIKTFAQSLIALIGAGVVSPIHLIDWKYCLSVAATAAILSILTSLAGLPEVDDYSEIDEG